MSIQDNKVSTNPFSKKEYLLPKKLDDKEKIDRFLKGHKGKKVIVIQGLGSVGAVMSTVCANAITEDYAVIGVDLANEENYWKIQSINEGVFPVTAEDKKIEEYFRQAINKNNLYATYDQYAYSKADVVIVDINLDVQINYARKREILNYDVDISGFKSAIESIAENCRENVLVLIETTVPPGVCEQIIHPILKEGLKKRGLDLDKFSFNKYNDFYSLTKSKGIKFKTWWSVPFLSNTRKNKLNYSNTKQTIKKLLKKSVKDQLLSDAPLGAFLSGGIDSSLIVSIMKQYDTNTKTFTIGFENNEYDESVEAKNIANYLGTDHTEYLFSKDSVIKMIPNVSQAYSEPFADSSQIPTMLVSNIASQKVKVALSGDGGDELFCGYNRYLYAHKYWKIIKILPIKLKIKLIKLIRLIPSKIYTRIILLLLPKITGSHFNHIDKILDKLIKIKDMKSYYQTMITEWNFDDDIMDFSNSEINNFNIFDEEFYLDSMMLNDFKAYLCDDILCKVDRSSMYYGLEVRTPYLMFELIEEAFSLPVHFKIKNNTTKYILRDILKDYLPEKFIDKPKRGFSMPISSWMKNELKDWTNDYLSKSNNSKHGFFNQDVIDKIKDQHFSNTYNHEHKLWSLIQFNSWYLNNYN